MSQSAEPRPADFRSGEKEEIQGAEGGEERTISAC